MSGPYTTLQELIDLRSDASSLSLYANQHVRSALSGQHRSRLRGRGIDFDEVRRYQPGDDIRTIDWRVTARSGKPHTKLFREERERPVFILLDQNPTMFFGSELNFKSVTAAQCAAAISWAALKHGDRIGGAVFNGIENRQIKPKRSTRTLLHWLNAVTEINNSLTSKTPPAPISVFNDALMFARSSINSGSAIFLISDCLHINPETDTQLFQLAKSHDVVVIRPIDRLEHEPPAPGRYVIGDGNSQSLLDTRDKDISAEYLRNCQTQQDEIENVLTNYAIPLINIRCGLPVIPQLQRVFAAGKIRKRYV